MKLHDDGTLLMSNIVNSGYRVKCVRVNFEHNICTHVLMLNGYWVSHSDKEREGKRKNGNRKVS